MRRSGDRLLSHEERRSGVMLLSMEERRRSRGAGIGTKEREKGLARYRYHR